MLTDHFLRPAGDPLEAEAIYKSFFGLDIDSKDLPTLEVGSVKTVIGHTEGTAGLAGVMKASLALQHGIIPPNLLFESLSPSVAPFYQNLHIPTVPMPWPKVAPGCPRRASVNSFGTSPTGFQVLRCANHESYRVWWEQRACYP